MSGKQFLKEKSGNLVCEECNAKTAPKCYKCKQLFGPGESYKKITDSIFYHNSCFLCCGPCKKPIGAEFYDMENDKYLCIDCYDKYGADYDQEHPPASAPPPVPTTNNKNNLTSDFTTKLNLNPTTTNVEILPARQRDPPTEQAPQTQTPTARPAPAVASADETCFKCKQKLSGQYTVYADKKYHSACFVCNKCNEQFKEKTFFKLNDNPVCRDCHTRHQIETASKCTKCLKPIMDTVVTFKNGEYHDYCLLCTMCSKKLIGQSIYTDKQDNTYCSDCFTKKEAKTCAKCLQLIVPSSPSLIFEQKYFHKGKIYI